MDLRQAIVANLSMSDFLVEAYLADLTPQELLARPCPAANHIAWQLGHLISSERWLVDKAAPGRVAALPADFEEKHKKAAATIDDPSAFLSKDEYRALAKKVRAQTLGVVESLSPADFDREISGVPPFIKTAGEALLFIGGHWVMHAGQWAITRRKLGRPPLF